MDISSIWVLLFCKITLKNTMMFEVEGKLRIVYNLYITLSK